MGNPRGKNAPALGTTQNPQAASPGRPAPPAVYRPERGRAVVQPFAAQGRPGPVAPPVYRPQPQPKCLQARTAEHARGASRKPSPPPPPANRDTHAPRVLQAKTNAPQRPPHPQKHNAAPTVKYTRTPPGVVQTKPSAAPDRRTPAGVPPPPANRPLPPGPRVPNGSVVQRDPNELIGLLLTGKKGKALAANIYSFMPTETLHAFSTVSKSTRRLAESERDRRNKMVPPFDLDKTFKGVMKTTPLGKQKGRGREGSRHIVRQPRSRDTDRTLQFLTELSFVLFAIVKKSVKEEQEVQCMEFNGKLVVTANDSQSISVLSKFLQKSKTDEFVEVVLDGMKSTTSLPMLERKASKMYDSTQEGTKRENFIPQQLVNLMRGKIQDIIEVVSLDQCVGKLLTPGPKILLLKPGAFHAEQNFALILAGYPGNVSTFTTSIAGKKRPCASCCVTLKLLHHFWGIDLAYIPRGGTYFTTANPGLEALVELGLRQFKFSRREVNEWLGRQIQEQESHTSKRKKYNGKNYADTGDTGIASESESDDDSAEEKLKERKKKRKIKKEDD